jgi:putative acetyltransferase
MLIRSATHADYPAILAVTNVAFADHPFSNHTEAAIIERLRQDAALPVSLVAVIDHAVVGYVAFSAVSISDGSRDWYGLGPVSVSPDLQKQGIGTALIRNGFEALKGLQARGCVVLGGADYYQRFGFRRVPNLILEGVPPEHFLATSFGESFPTGTVSYHPAFSE